MTKTLREYEQELLEKGKVTNDEINEIKKALSTEGFTEENDKLVYKSLQDNFYVAVKFGIKNSLIFWDYKDESNDWASEYYEDGDLQKEVPTKDVLENTCDIVQMFIEGNFEVW